MPPRYSRRGGPQSSTPGAKKQVTPEQVQAQDEQIKALRAQLDALRLKGKRMQKELDSGSEKGESKLAAVTQDLREAQQSLEAVRETNKSLTAQIKATERRTEELSKRNMEELTLQVEQHERDLLGARHKEQNLKHRTRAICARNEYIAALMAAVMHFDGQLLRSYLPEMKCENAEEFRHQMEERLRSGHGQSDEEAEEEQEEDQLKDDFMDIIHRTLTGLHEAQTRHDEMQGYSDEMAKMYEALAHQVKQMDESTARRHGRDWALLDKFRDIQELQEDHWTAMRQYAEECSKLSEQVMFSRQNLGIGSDLSPQMLPDQGVEEQ